MTSNHCAMKLSHEVGYCVKKCCYISSVNGTKFCNVSSSAFILRTVSDEIPLIRFCILNDKQKKHRALLKLPNIWTVIKPRLLLSMQKLQPKPRSFGSKMQNMQWHCLKNLVVRRFSITWATKPRKDSRVGLKALTTAIMIISLTNTERQRNCVITKYDYILNNLIL